MRMVPIVVRVRSVFACESSERVDQAAGDALARELREFAFDRAEARGHAAREAGGECGVRTQAAFECCWRRCGTRRPGRARSRSSCGVVRATST